MGAIRTAGQGRRRVGPPRGRGTRRVASHAAGVGAILIALTLALALMTSSGSAGAVAVREAHVRQAITGPFLTLLFSRTAVTAASRCVEDDSNVVRLDTVVAPALSALGLRPSGSIETAPTQESNTYCGHYGSTLYASWSLERILATTYGWSFVSHTATYPSVTGWTTANIYAETCGSRDTITGEGLPGASGSMAWPGGHVYKPALPDVKKCYDFSRLETRAITTEGEATTPPYYENSTGFRGGPCNDPSAACYSYSFVHAPHRYSSPSAMLAIIDNATSTDWLTLQSYLFVSGAQPGEWDCTSPNWQDHWTYDTERYCWSDYLSVVSAIPSTVTVTDPASVGATWGRTVAP